MKYFPVLLLAALLSACTGIGRGPAEPRATAENAARAYDEANYELAGTLYSRLAVSEDQPAQRDEYHYLAAKSLFQAGYRAQAEQMLRKLTEGSISSDLAINVQLLRAEIALRQNPDETLELLFEPRDPNAGNPKLARFHRLRAEAYARKGDHLQAAREAVFREFYLESSEDIAINQKVIWETLNKLNPAVLELMQSAPPPDILSGWMELVRLSKLFQLEPKMMLKGLAQWEQAYFNHPVQREFLDELYARSQELISRPDNIAILLPLSGRYAQAGAAVRDGIISAYYQSPHRDEVSLLVYDVGDNPADILNIYQKAIAEGANFVIGPLSKEAVEQLADEKQLPVPTLALNQIGIAKNRELMQFSLAPEQEGVQVAERAWLEGYANAAALLPTGDMGDRLYDAFYQRWSELGGNIVSSSRYNPKQSDFSGPIKSLLNIHASEERHRKIAALIREDLEFTPQIRQDVDFIFLSAFPRQARLLRPQIKYHHGEELPILATSHVNAGETNPAQDKDMNDIIFTDTPWTLEGDTPNKELRHLTQQAFGNRSAAFQRLLALGVDAYHLVFVYKLLETYPFERYEGETGTLTLDKEGAVQRQLIWAQYRKGRFERLEELAAGTESDLATQ